MTRELAVLGHPIAHSKSPALHAAAYEVLGLDWHYGMLDVTEESLGGILSSLGPEWLGLSLTMPLKRAVLSLVSDRTPLVDALGLGNTVLFGERPKLFNTDVRGILDVLEPVPRIRTAVVLGGGATAASALEALRLRGADRRVVGARSPQRAAVLEGLATAVVPLEVAGVVAGSADVVISTLPGSADAPPLPDRVPGTPLLDVAYDPWPTPTGAVWQAAGGTLLHALDMLIGQAIGQVRVFVHADPDVPLPDEPAVREAMRAAVGR